MIQCLQRDYHVPIKDIFSMNRFEFETMIDSLGVDTKKLKAEEEREIPAMTIDQAFPQFFTDPNVRRGD